MAALASRLEGRPRSRPTAAGPRPGLLLVLLPLIVLAGCIQDDGRRFNPLRQFSPIVSEDDERELGWEFDQALQESVMVIHDPVVAGFLSDLGQSIVEKIEPQPFVYRFRVVKAPGLNAFAVPGGFIYFHSDTLLSAGSVDELAGVMGHEIAHVKAHHYARMRKESAIPDLATQIVGMSAAIAAKEPGLLAIAQGLNVSMKLRYGRELESEADELGGVFMTRAGYQPAGIARFFERILMQQERHPNNVPPYLYSHPDVEDRIELVRIRAADLKPRPRPEGEDLEAELREAQARLAMLLDSRRAILPAYGPPPDRSITDPLLAQAEAKAAAGELDAALLVLARAESEEPNDPRVPFRIAELLQESGRLVDSIRPLRRTARLDPTRALVFYKLGLAYKAAGDRHRAVFAFEQAQLRAGDTSDLRKRAVWEVEKLAFPVVTDSGFAASDEGWRESSPEGSPARPEGTPQVAWWVRLGPHFAAYADRIRVRWTAPSGAIALEEPARPYRKPYVGSVLASADPPLTPGTWRVEALLDDDPVRTETLPLP